MKAEQIAMDGTVRTLKMKAPRLKWTYAADGVASPDAAHDQNWKPTTLGAWIAQITQGALTVDSDTRGWTRRETA
ncbi:hypothetical protein AGMMS49992_25820 [Clostridia bacterium]|nr:hypothetical protein AGMMS49992_25820 [Clostridia bacterium]